ncbi:MAG: tetratricopeptide repeat protein, partial [Deltaproteobacteria bacterium]|nr:tetratricopeptide repeat protein [Deltaproteobacteria bacterium]
GDHVRERHRHALRRVAAHLDERSVDEAGRGHHHVQDAVLGATDLCLADLDAGVPAVGGFDLGAALLRHLVEQRSGGRPGFGPRSLEELSEGLSRLGLERERQFAIRTVPGLEEAFGEAFRRLAGNRSGFGTVLRAGALRPLGPSLSPRAAARRTLELIRVCPPDEVLARFDAVQAAWPDSSMGLVHRAELLLWMGRHEEARAAFRGSLAINHHTRWGWIGQLANDSFLGDPEGALVVGEEGVRVMGGYGPSHFVYRGEALRRLGRLDEAKADLEYAVGLNPSRMGARLTLALLCSELGDAPGMRAQLGPLRAACAGMLATALEEEGLSTDVLWGAGGSAGDVGRVLLRGHEMMRGNRSSSCHTWFNSEGQLRVNETRGDGQDPFRERMDDRLNQAAAILSLE